MRAWQRIRAILLLPVMATIVIPATLLSVFGWDSLLGLRLRSGEYDLHSAIQRARSRETIRRRAQGLSQGCASMDTEADAVE